MTSTFSISIDDAPSTTASNRRRVFTEGVCPTTSKRLGVIWYLILGWVDLGDKTSAPTN